MKARVFFNKFLIILIYNKTFYKYFLGIKDHQVVLVVAADIEDVWISKRKADNQRKDFTPILVVDFYDMEPVKK